MRAVFFGTYNRGHSANRIVARALRASGFDTLELHEALWERTRDKGPGYFGPIALVALGTAWLGAARRLAVRWRAMGGAPLVVCGFNGQLDVLLARLIAGRGVRIVFAPLVTITETLVEDRERYRPGSLMARLFTKLDRFCMSLADTVVIDSEEHRHYLIDLGMDPSRVLVCHLGVDSEAFPLEGPPLTEPRRDRLEVLYFGQYLPLHGLDVVVDAVARLAHRDDLEFVFIGTGDDRPRVEREVRASRAHATFIDWVPYAELAARIARADIVLGIFGASCKARMVIPNKVYEAAALGRAIVTADTKAIREVFEPDRELVVCQPDATALAATIEGLVEDSELRLRLGAAAQELVRRRFCDEALARSWALALAGPDLASWRRRPDHPRLGVVIVNFNDSQATLACLASLGDDRYPDREVLVIDNGSLENDVANLEAGMKSTPSARLILQKENTGYAGANNRGLADLFDRGCDFVFVLNNDTEVTAGTCDALVACAVRHPDAGLIGPLVARDVPGSRPASLGERCWRLAAWLPRSLVRFRRMRGASYAVGGVQGCAALFSRSLYETCGGFDENFFAYYEEVDFCLRARRSGFVARVEPRAEIAHRGHRGFGGGMNSIAAYLKARNLWFLGTREAGAFGTAVFAVGYVALIATSAIAYLGRGRRDIARAQLAGFRAALRGEVGRPPESVFGDAVGGRDSAGRASR
ncbi:MAG: GT2 family glycosyltransferase/glycosyltransferase involved in cell wall biosynthesis [Hyphomicrobiaceae bacterium]|jgi:GT2 family glycosyltransferase/glycosyltransferase involved in cell wall biosynthesis